MDIEEVIEILSYYPLLKKPRHVLLVKEPIYGVMRVDEKAVLVKVLGVTPMNRDDTIVLAIDAKPDTVIHECIHLYGLGELAAYTLTPILITKYKLGFAPIAKMLRYRVRYRKCQYPREPCPFPLAHEKYRDRVEHYILEW